MSFTPERLLSALGAALGQLASPPRGLCVALSGGLDSTALLAALAPLSGCGAVAPLRAVHVDHGLHADSAHWSRRCTVLAAGLGVPCEIARVDARPAPGESPEAAARAARYLALGAALRPGEVLLTAHHGDDQLETVLLQWLRGGGLRSIAGMRPMAPFGAGWHLRPLLGFARAELEGWARQQGLEWLEDPSNLDTRFDRNYLRLEVLPAVRRRWPAAVRTIGRVAAQATEALDLEAEAATVDLVQVAAGAALSLPRLRELNESRQRRVLREWLRRRALPLPSAATLEALRHDMLAAAADRVPATRWPGGVVRRYRERLYADAAGPSDSGWAAGALGPGADLDLGPLGRLELQAARGVGLSRTRLIKPLRIVPRPPGAVFQPAGSAHRRDLRKWLQERGVLPWRRESLPIACAGEEIVAVGDLAYGGGLAAAPGEDSWRIVWHERPALTESEASAQWRDA